MTHIEIGDLYTHPKIPNHIYILHEVSKTCVHLLNTALGTVRTVRNDIFEREWQRTGAQA